MVPFFYAPITYANLRGFDLYKIMSKANPALIGYSSRAFRYSRDEKSRAVASIPFIAQGLCSYEGLQVAKNRTR